MSKYITNEELEDYGPEFVNLVRRAVREATDPLNAQISTLQASVQFATAEAGNALVTRMRAELDQLVPGWDRLNTDPGFVAWSRQAETFSGVQRSHLMQQAWNSGDAQRLASFFRAYRPGAEGQAYHPHTAQQRPHVDSRPTYSAADVAKFYSDVARGRWRNREQERQRIDIELQQAAREGRVIQSLRGAAPATPRGEVK